MRCGGSCTVIFYYSRSDTKYQRICNMYMDWTMEKRAHGDWERAFVCHLRQTVQCTVAGISVLTLLYQLRLIAQ